jgi:uncharacterized protein YggT (Ycf19 family)
MTSEGSSRSPVEIFLRIGRAVVWLFYAIALVNAALLATAFALRLFGANPDAGFTEWVFRSTERSMRPFRGIFPDRALGDTSVLDMSLLFAALVYLVAAVVIDGLFRWMGHKLTEQQAADQRARTAEAQQFPPGQPRRPGQPLPPGQAYSPAPSPGQPLPPGQSTDPSWGA